MVNAAQRNNARLVGSGEQTLILAHGFGTDQNAWRRIQEPLAADYRLLLFDHVGATAESAQYFSPRRYQSMHAYAADLLELLTELDIEDAYYLGHSMSAMIGVHAALSEPERFRKLLLLNGTPCYANQVDGYRGGFERSDIDSLYDSMAGNYQGWVGGVAALGMGNPERPELAAEFAESLSAMRPDIALAMAHAIFDPDHRDQLAALTVPSVVLQAIEDAFVPLSVAEFMAETIPDAELCPIAASGHLPHISAPEQVLAALRSHLDS
ncbi:alpha/beta fold hydrolase [Haliangium ochraceum]|nr:alpha/beta hydrolase [Haliangium ochraceum]